MTGARGARGHGPACMLATLALAGSIALCACGSGTAKRGAMTLSGTTSTYANTITTSAIPPGQALRGDGDVDNPGDIDGNGDPDLTSHGGSDGDSDGPTPESYDFPDRDDRATFAYGHTASAAEARAIASVVRAYYAAAAAGNGAAGCKVLLAGFAGSLAEAYAEVSGPPYLRGARTCAAVMSALFRHFRPELEEAITVVEVRVADGRAQVIVGSRRMRASSISLVRSDGAWRVNEIIGQALP